MNKNEELSKHTLYLRAGDYDRLRSMFPDIGAAVVIRKIVSRFLDRDQQDAPKEVEINL